LNLDAVKNAYRRYARQYDFYFGAVLQPGRDAVIENLNCRPGDRILEVGVGTGLSLPLYPSDVQVTGIDVSTEMLALAQARKKRLGLNHVRALYEMDAQNMEFADGSFDRVVAMYVASVVPSPKALVDEMRRVCRADGEIVVVNHFRASNPLIASMESLCAPLSGLIGFRPDIRLPDFIQQTDLDVFEANPVNLFGYWTMLRAHNNKNAVSEQVPVDTGIGNRIESGAA
jgi:phosphatidylethanolamine/phosphatidyl-N-methylethanolamine N-methyltransferase